jgi:hypothetical protein
LLEVKRADATSQATPTHAKGESGSLDSKKSSVSTFIFMALNMSWQLAIVFLVPVIGGVKLDKHFGTSYLYTFIGLGLATIGSGLIMRRTLQVANRMPVPKLTAAQRRKIQKEYEAEDED